jgi:lipopolysaccharide export system protein LptA
MTRWLRLIAAIMALAAPGAAAQSPVQSPLQNPMQGLQGQNKDLPIHIEAATLEVHDKAKTATFSGNVQVVQGDTTMRCKSLVVFYGADEGASAAKPAAATRPAATAGSATATPGPANGTPGSATATPGLATATPGMPQGAQSIRRIEARGGVTVVTKDQNASGELGVYDLKTKTITLTGNVVVSQGKNVLHGERVVVDTATGNARVESGATAHDRVRALIQPGKGANGTPGNVMSLGPSRPN